MELLTIQLAANETKSFRKAGGYIEIIDSVNPISISMYSVLGGQTNSITGGLSGLFLDASFGAFDVRNGAAAQVVTILVCDEGEGGGTRRQPGNVRVIDEITDAIQTAAFQGVTDVTAFSVQQLVAPAANATGMMIRLASAGGAAGAGGLTSARVIACKTTPTALFNPTQCYQLVENFSSATTDNGTTQRMNKRLPPGWGLFLVWQIKTAVPATGPSGVVQYELL